jgi:hypothetical protein
MELHFMRLAVITVASVAMSAPTLADSVASSASSAGSASVGSLSDSISGSSRSSSPDNKAAEGDYRVIEVAEIAARPGMLRLQLQAMTPREGDGPIWLTLPQQALAPKALVPGDIVSAQRRPYGIEFARGARAAPDREAFFLALADDWLGELAPRAVKL